VALGCGALLAKRHMAAAAALLIAAWVLWFGMTGLPWVGLTAIMIALGASLGGARLAMICAAGCAFFVVTGLWSKAMLSLYLTGTAVLISLVLGGAIGLLAFRVQRLSAALRIVADVLQTMPQFVLLIPFLMFFQVGEFTALLAICIYAIVPAIRYTEQGLRGVSPHVVEAAEQMGCSEWQILWHVRLPLAMPVLALGINQTIMFALAMLAIAALVGTQGLEQEVYVALSQAAAGQGLLAGIGIAIIAIVSDRLIRARIDTTSATRAPHLPAPA